MGVEELGLRKSFLRSLHVLSELTFDDKIHSEMENASRRRITAYERILGDIAKPQEQVDEEEEEEVIVLEQTRMDIFFEACLAVRIIYMYLLTCDEMQQIEKM